MKTYSYHLLDGIPCRIEHGDGPGDMRVERYKPGKGFVPGRLMETLMEGETVSKRRFEQEVIALTRR